MAAALQAALASRPPASQGLLAPTARPAEPVTQGLPVGAGAGPEVLSGMPTASPGDDVLSQMYAAFQANPTDAMRRLIAVAEQQRGNLRA